MTFKRSITIGIGFFGLVVSIALTTFYLSLDDCPNGLLCDNGTLCVPQKLVCDIEKDCEDGNDEDKVMCGNLYGSNEVSFTAYLDGTKKYYDLKAQFKFEDDEYSTICRYNLSDVPKGCDCEDLLSINCQDQNRTKIPRNFPINVERIILSNNKIDLNLNDTFEVYKDLTNLDLRNNRISHIPARFLQTTRKLRRLFLQYNKLRHLPEILFMPLKSLKWLLINNNQLEDVNPHIFAHLHDLQYLELSNNQFTMEKKHFPRLYHLKELFLDFNLIETIDDYQISNLKNLTLLSLRHNNIRFLSAMTFRHLKVLQEIRLSDNPIVEIESRIFMQLRELNALYLDNLHINLDEEILSTLNVSFLSLKGISYNKIDFNAIRKIERLEHIIYEKFVYCSNTAWVKKCYPKTDGISSSTDMLDEKIRYYVWFMTLLTCAGNASVLMSRLRDENKNVSIVIRNLAFSDLIMGIYLGMIGYIDIHWRDVYHQNSGMWLKSWQCAFIGILAMTSSEVSLFILTFMSIERFLLISDPFGHHKLNTRNVMLSLFIIWLVGVAIAILPVILFHSSTKFYGIYNGGTCFPLFLNEVYPTGWIYSAFVFLGINFTLLVLIATLYTALLVSIFRTRRATSLNFFDCEFAIRFFFIVLTDVCCWSPIIVLKFLVFYDMEISSDVYLWLIIFVLPLNSALNPFLYTFTTPKYRDQIFAAFVKPNLKKHEISSNQITADESQTKVSLLYNSNGSISKWKIFSK